MLVRPDHHGITFDCHRNSELVVRRAVGGGELGYLAPPTGHLSEYIGGAGINDGVASRVRSVTRGRSNHDNIAVHCHGIPKVVSRRGVGGDELGGQFGFVNFVWVVPVGPAVAGGGLGKYVSRTGVAGSDALVVGDVVLVRPDYDGITIHCYGVPELVARRGDGGGELGCLAPHAVNLGEDVGSTGVAGSDVLVVGDIVLVRSDHDSVAVDCYGIPELVVVSTVVGGQLALGKLQ